MKIKICDYCKREIKETDQYTERKDHLYHLECFGQIKPQNKWDKLVWIFWVCFGMFCGIAGIIIGIVYAVK